MFRITVLALLVASTALAVDYESARSLSNRLNGSVKNETVIPVWGPEALYYRFDGKILRVDAASGQSSPAIESRRLKKYFAGKAPRIHRFEVDKDGGFICLAQAGKSIRTLRVSGDAIEETDAFALVPNKATKNVKSKNGGKASMLAFINDTANAVDIFWVDTSKVRKKYTMLQPGDTFVRNTFAGHAFIAGNLAFTAEEQPAVARLSANPVEAKRNRLPPKWKVEFKNYNLHVTHRTSGRTAQLTTNGSNDWKYCGPLHWSPCGRYLVAMREKIGTQRQIDLIHAVPDNDLQPRRESISYLKAGDELNVRKPHLFDLQAGREIPIDDSRFSNPWSITRFHWSSDGKRLFFVYNERGHQTLRLLAMRASSGKVETVLEETSPTFIDYSQKLYLHHLDETDEALWMSERSGWNHLYLVDRKTGQSRPITAGEWVVRGIDHVDPDKRQVWFRAAGIHPGQDPYYIHHARINFDGTGLVVLTEANGTHEIQFSANRKFFTDTWSRVDQPPVHELRRSSDGAKIADLGRADISKLLAVHPHLPEPFVAKGRDGITDIHGVIFRPSHFDPSRKYPVVEAIYAGPHGYFVPKAFKPFHGPQRMAELGFIVVRIDGMGTNWRSKKFHDVCWKNLKDSGFPDRIAWMKVAAEKYPCMDLSRVGIYGGSAGGQSAMRAVLDHAGFYKAAAADCGCHDNRMDKIWWNEAWMGWPVDESYAQSSNADDAHKLGGKLLLTVGMLDRNVDPATTMQVVDALIKADKDFEFIAFPSLGHGAGESPYGKRRREAFFIRHLLDME